MHKTLLSFQFSTDVDYHKACEACESSIPIRSPRLLDLAEISSP